MPDTLRSGHDNIMSQVQEQTVFYYARSLREGIEGTPAGQ